MYYMNEVIDDTTYANRIYAHMLIWILFFKKGGNILSAVLATFILIKCVVKIDRHSILYASSSSWTSSCFKHGYTQYYEFFLFVEALIELCI